MSKNKHHSFNIDEAVKYGIEKAIILHNLRFWLDHNKANGTNIHDGYYWTYNSSKAFAELFPYLKERSIRKWLTDLEKDGIIKSGNYNKSSYDRTKWYTIVGEYEVMLDASAPDANGLGQGANGMLLDCQPIPDINKDINTDDDKEASSPILHAVEENRRKAKAYADELRTERENKVPSFSEKENPAKAMIEYLKSSNIEEKLQKYPTYMKLNPKSKTQLLKDFISYQAPSNDKGWKSKNDLCKHIILYLGRREQMYIDNTIKAKSA